MRNVCFLPRRSSWEGYLSPELSLPGQLSVPADQLHPLSGRQAKEYVADLVTRSAQLEGKRLQGRSWLERVHVIPVSVVVIANGGN